VSVASASLSDTTPPYTRRAVSKLRLFILLAAMVLCTAVMVMWLHSPMLPLGVPGEWSWPPISWTDAHRWAWISNLILAAAITGIVAGTSRFLSPSRAARSTTATRAAVSAIVMTVALGWWFHLLASVPGPFGLLRSPFVLFYPRMTGYYQAARHPPENARDYLRSYERTLKELKGPERYLHLGTHPPGLILFSRGIQSLTASSPALVRALEATMPEPIRDANETIKTESTLSRRDFTREDAAALWFITLLTMLSTAGCIPLLAILLRAAGHSERSALRWSALWMFTPAVAVFLPKDDILFAFASLLAGVLWIRALDLDSRWRAALAGVVCFTGLFFSLAFIPVMLWLTIATIWRWWNEDRTARASEAPPVRTVKPRAGALAAGLAGVLIPIFVLLAGFETNIVSIWRQNLQNHAEFYQHNDRSYGKWLVANVGELMFATGPAVFVIAIAGVVLLRRSHAPEDQRSKLGAAGLLVLAALWLSGKNMGEAARLWIAFLPWLLLCMPRLREPNASPERPAAPPWLWWSTAALQAIACIAAATQIDGFGFSQL
jgi:hypothetical protein